jgi:hypothetical protein
MPSEIVWEKCDTEVKPMVSDLIQSYQDDLHHIKPSRIGYLTFSKKKSKKMAFITRVGQMYGMFVDLDYIMCIHLESWMDLTISSKKVLIYHELCHVPENGFDPEAKEYRKVQDHDVKDFDAIISKFGIHWEHSEKILNPKKYANEAKKDEAKQDVVIEDKV